MKFMKGVHCSDEFCGDAPEVLVVEIGPELAGRIKGLSAEVRRLEVYAIELFDYTPTWHYGDWEQDETEAPVPREEFTGLDLNTLHVSSDGFWWEAHLKGSSVSLQSEPIPISRLS